MYLKHSQLPKPATYQHLNTYDLKNDILLKNFLIVNANADMLTLSDDGGVQNGFVCAFFSSSGNDKEKEPTIRGLRVYSNKEQLKDYLAQYHQEYQYSSSGAVISCIKKGRSKL